MSVDLPAPDGPTRKTKSPSGMTRSTSRRASLPFGYCLRDVVEDEDGPLLLGLVAASGRGRGVGGSARRSGLGRRSQFGSAGEACGDARRSSIAAVDSVRGHGQGSHVGAEATTGPGVRQT